MNILFNMSCGHAEEREVADPSKYLKIDREYYAKQGLCSACWAKLRAEHKQQSHVKQN
jgi:hypothetical protein